LSIGEAMRASAVLLVSVGVFCFLGEGLASARPRAVSRGDELAFVHHGQIWVVDADGRRLRQVTATKGPEFEDDDPAWSPDGSRLTFVHEKTDVPEYFVLETIRLSNGKRSDPPSGMSGNPNGGSSNPYAPSWSPATGSKLAYVAYAGTGVSGNSTFGLYVLTLPYGPETLIARYGEPIDKWGLAVRGYEVSDYSWSPDGKWFCLSASPGTDGTPRLLRVYIVRSRGGNLIRLSNSASSDCAWSPDGRTVAFSTGRNIVSVRIADRRVTLITRPGAESEASPVWSPDGRMIGYLRQESRRRNAPYDLWTTSVRSRVPRRIATKVSEASWSPDGKTIAFIKEGALWAANRNGSNPSELVNGANELAWRPPNHH
jgi:Tol biopolymer transport system component